MATAEQRARRRAQRETAARVRAPKYQPVAPRAARRAVRASQEAYGRRVMAGSEPMPAKRGPGSNVLASLASRARWGKADPAFEAAFSKYWYHKESEQEGPDEADEAYDYEADEDEDEE